LRHVPVCAISQCKKNHFTEIRPTTLQNSHFTERTAAYFTYPLVHGWFRSRAIDTLIKVLTGRACV